MYAHHVDLIDWMRAKEALTFTNAARIRRGFVKNPAHNGNLGPIRIFQLDM